MQKYEYLRILAGYVFISQLGIEYLAFPGFILMALYNHKRGRKLGWLKYFFYLFYPVHLTLIYIRVEFYSNQFSKRRMKLYLDEQMKGKSELDSSQLPLSCKKELLANIAAVTYCEENGYEITVEDGYTEANGMVLHRFKIRRKKDGV